MKLHDLHLSVSDAKALAALVGAHRRAPSFEPDPFHALAELLAHARHVAAGP